MPIYFKRTSICEPSRNQESGAFIEAKTLAKIAESKQVLFHMVPHQYAKSSPRPRLKIQRLPSI